MEKAQPFPMMMLEQWDIYTQKKDFNIHVSPYTKMNSKYIINLHVKSKTIKPLENIKENLCDLGEENMP